MASNIISSTVGGILGGAGNALGLNSTPTNTQVQLDPATQGLLNNGTQAALAPTSTYANNLSQGVNQAADSFNPNSQQTSQETARLGGDAGYTQALRNQYASQSNKSIEDMKMQNQFTAEQRKAQAMNEYAKAALGQQQATTNFNNMMANSYIQSQAARAQAVGSLFQTAGSIGGGAIAKNGNAGNLPSLGGGENFSQSESNEWGGR